MWNTNSRLGITRKILICVAVLFGCVSFVKSGCGGYIELTAGGSHDLSSSTTYSAYSNCIWVIKVPDKYVVNGDFTFRGEKSSGGACEDYLVVTDGSDSANELLNTCDDLTNRKLNSTARWMYIQFKADGATNVQGLSATVKPMYTGTDMSAETDPIPKCKSHQFSCSNKRCITMSYRCDGFNDCGCVVDCDEQNCGGISMSKSSYMGLGAGLGTAMFITCFVSVYAYEKRRKLKAMREEEESERASKRRGGPWAKTRARTIKRRTRRSPGIVSCTAILPIT